MTTECREVRERADAFLSDQLLVETMQDIVRHLDGCPACRAEFDGRERMKAAVKQAFERSSDLQPRPEFVAALTARLAAEAAGSSGVAPAVAAPAPWHRWGAIAATLLLSLALGLGSLQWLSPSTLEALARIAAGDHQNCALTPRLAEAPISLEQAARVHDAAYRALESVMPETTALPGGLLEILGRHSCVWDGVRFAHLVLRYRETIVSVVVAGQNDAPPSWLPWQRLAHGDADVPSVDAMQMTSVTSDRHVVFVVSTLPADDVQTVARVMNGPVMRALGGI